MPLFCTKCNNLTAVITTADTFYYKCGQCQSEYKPTDDESMKYEDVTGQNLSVFSTILLNASKDPVNPKVAKNCIKCDSKFVKQVRIGAALQIINACIGCDHRWHEGIE